MILRPVTHHSRDVVIPGARTNALVLFRSNFYLINVVMVPDRPKAWIGKAKDQHVLDRLFPQVMIYTVDLFFADHLEQLTVERLRRGSIAAKRLFDNEAPPATAVTLEERGGSKFVCNFPIELRRDRGMKNNILGNRMLPLQPLEAFMQPGIVLCRWRIKIPAHKIETRGKLPPCLLAKAFFLLGIGPDCIAKSVVIPHSAGHPEQGKGLRQQPLTSQGIERRHKS